MYRAPMHQCDQRILTVTTRQTIFPSVKRSAPVHSRAWPGSDGMVLQKTQSHRPPHFLANDFYTVVLIVKENVVARLSSTTTSCGPAF